jgi:hypothetical protein
MTLTRANYLGILMPSHLDYTVVRQRQQELARRAERARQARDGASAAPGAGKRTVRLLFATLRMRRPASAPASTR